MDTFFVVKILLEVQPTRSAWWPRSVVAPEVGARANLVAFIKLDEIRTQTGGRLQWTSLRQSELASREKTHPRTLVLGRRIREAYGCSRMLMAAALVLG